MKTRGIKYIYVCLAGLILFTLFISCKEQITEPESGSPALIIPGQNVRAMIVNLSNGKEYYVVNETLLARGGTPLSGYTWSVANLSAMPSGTIVNPLTGIFQSSGGILVNGTHKFRMTASDGSRTATAEFTLIVEEYNGFGPLAVFQQPLGIHNIYLPDAIAGYGYGASLWALGDGELPWSWYLESGNLPEGLVIDQANGLVRGTPSSSASGNTYTFTVKVKDSNGEEAVTDPLYYHIKVAQ